MALKKRHKSAYASKTIERGLDVLAVIAQSDIGLLPGEIAKLSRISRPAAYRAIAGLEAKGFVRRLDHSRRYVVAARAVQLIQGRRIDDGRYATLRAAILKLCTSVLWPVSVAGPAGVKMLVWATTDDATPLALERFQPGFRVPMLESASGIAYLAHLPAADQAELLNQLAASDEPHAALARNRTQCQNLLRDCKRRGYAMTTHGPHAARMRARPKSGQQSQGRTTSLSVPITVKNRPIACLAVRYFDTALTRPKAVQKFLGPLRETAKAIAAAWAPL